MWRRVSACFHFFPALPCLLFWFPSRGGCRYIRFQPPAAKEQRLDGSAGGRLVLKARFSLGYPGGNRFHCLRRVGVELGGSCTGCRGVIHAPAATRHVKTSSGETSPHHSRNLREAAPRDCTSIQTRSKPNRLHLSIVTCKKAEEITAILL